MSGLISQGKIKEMQPINRYSFCLNSNLSYETVKKTILSNQFLTLRILTMAKSLNDMMNLFHGLTVGVIFGT